jgi:hypothetical protein
VKLWNRLLIFLCLRRDWVNEIDFAPPAFDSVPHEYDLLRSDGVVLTYCALCGGGPKHPIHTGLAIRAQLRLMHRTGCMTPASDPHRPPIMDACKPRPWGRIYASSLEEEHRRADAERLSKDSLEAGDIVRHHFNHEND